MGAPGWGDGSGDGDGGGWYPYNRVFVGEGQALVADSFDVIRNLATPERTEFGFLATGFDHGLDADGAPDLMMRTTYPEAAFVATSPIADRLPDDGSRGALESMGYQITGAQVGDEMGIFALVADLDGDGLHTCDLALAVVRSLGMEIGEWGSDLALGLGIGDRGSDWALGLGIGDRGSDWATPTALGRWAEWRAGASKSSRLLTCSRTPSWEYVPPSPEPLGWKATAFPSSSLPLL